MLGRLPPPTGARCNGHGTLAVRRSSFVPFRHTSGARVGHRRQVTESVVPGVETGPASGATAALSQALKADAFAPLGHPDSSLGELSPGAGATWTLGQPNPDQLHLNGHLPRHSNGHAVAAADAADGEDDADSGTAASHQLHQELRECSCVQDVLDVVADEHQVMSAHNTATALQCLVKLTGRLPSKAERRKVLGEPSFLVLLQLLQKHAPGMNAFQLVTSYYNTARLGAPLTKLPALLQRLDGALASLLPQLSGRDVADILHAWATLRHRPEQQLLRDLSSRATQLVAAGECSAQSVSMMLWALGTARLRLPGDELPRAAAAALAGPLGQGMAPQGWANSLWALSKMGLSDQALMAAGCEQVARGLAPPAAAPAGGRGSSDKGRGGGSRPWQLQEVLNVLWAAAAARHHPGKHINAFITHCTRRVQAMTPADMSSLFHGLGVFGHRPGPQDLDLLLARAGELLPRMSPAEVAGLYWGLGMMRAVDNPLYLQLTESKVPALWAAGQLAGEGPSSSSSSSSSGVSKDDSRRNSGAEASTSGSSGSGYGRAGGSLLRQAFQGYLAGKLEGVAPKWEAPLLADCKEAWVGAAVAGKASAVVRELQGLARQLGVVLLPARTTKDECIMLDVAVQASGGRLAAVQVLLPHDVASNTGELLAAVRWQRDVMERNGFADVHFLPAADYQRLPLGSRPQFLADLLRRLGVGVRRDALMTAQQKWAAREQRQRHHQQQQPGGEDTSADGSSSSSSSTQQGAVGGWGELSSSSVSAAEAGLLLGALGDSPAGTGGSSRGGRRQRGSRTRQ